MFFLKLTPSLLSEIKANNRKKKCTAVGQALITPAIVGKCLTSVGRQFNFLSFHGFDPSPLVCHVNCKFQSSVSMAITFNAGATRSVRKIWTSCPS